MTCVTNGQTNGPCGNWTFSASTNRLTTSGCTNYDASGDMTTDCSTGHTYQWDAEGRVSSVDSGTTWGFTYNALGHRVQWVVGLTVNNHMFDPNGGWQGMYGALDVLRWGDGAYAFYNGSETYFNHVNNIGSTSVYTNHAGTAAEDVVFFPWGDTWQTWGSGGYSFAEMPYYDTTTYTSPTLNRFYSMNLGRWHSPDPVVGDPSNPQSWDRYAYVLNNPTSLVDPLGLSAGDPMNCTTQDNGVIDCQPVPPEEASQSNQTGGGDSPPTQDQTSPGDLYIPFPTINMEGSGLGLVSAPNNCTNGWGTGGAGVGAGYNADLGVGAAGASSTGGVGGGLFHNGAGGLFGGYSGGLSASGGTAAYAGSHMAGVPSQTSSSFVLGGYAGAGANFFFTNAGGSQQLAGPFTTVSVNVGIGIANLGVQLSFGGGIWQLSVTPPIASVGYGAAGSVIRTNTVATHAGCH